MNVMHINLGRLSIRISFCFLKEINYPGDYFTGISRFLPNLRKFVFVICFNFRSIIHFQIVI